MKPALETENLRMVFKGPHRGSEVVAVDDLNLSVGEGEIVGFIGPNGAGKTTTIKVLLGLLFPTEGESWDIRQARNGPDGAQDTCPR